MLYIRTITEIRSRLPCISLLCQLNQGIHFRGHFKTISSAKEEALILRRVKKNIAGDVQPFEGHIKQLFGYRDQCYVCETKREVLNHPKCEAWRW